MAKSITGNCLPEQVAIPVASYCAKKEKRKKKDPVHASTHVITIPEVKKSNHLKISRSYKFLSAEQDGLNSLHFGDKDNQHHIHLSARGIVCM